jgi:hypothetical protein
LEELVTLPSKWLSVRTELHNATHYETQSLIFSVEHIIRESNVGVSPSETVLMKLKTELDDSSTTLNERFCYQKKVRPLSHHNKSERRK